MTHCTPKIGLHKVITIGGGSGQFALLSGLRDLDGLTITAIVSMMDSGGSTGRLRDELGILPPGDILKCLLALSPHPEPTRSLLLKRFEKDRRLRGHNAGNLLLTMLSKYTGSFSAGLMALGEILDVKGTILPVTTDPATLVAELTDGSRIFGETAIDIPHGAPRKKFRDLYLVPHYRDAIQVYPPVVKAIEAADYIIMGPGDLFTSIIPNLIVPGVAESLCKCKGKLIYITNIMTKFGETHNFKAPDFVHHLESLIQRDLDLVIYNNRRPDNPLCTLYAHQKSEFVEASDDDPLWQHRNIIYADLLETDNNVIRHDPQKLGIILSDLIGLEAT